MRKHDVVLGLWAGLYKTARRGVVGFVTLVMMCGGGAWTRAAELDLGSAIDLGEVNAIGSIDWNYNLGTSWDTNFSLGGIIGSENATIIPEVTIAGKTVIPEVKADTRTGAKFSGSISGGVGLNFYANFQASQLKTGSDFDFKPTVDTPTEFQVGSFIKLQTTTGMQSNAAFDNSNVTLPSFNAGMDFYFDMALNSTVETGLFPFIPYSSTSFSPDPLHVNQNLLNFGFDLDPANPTPPTFSMFTGTAIEQTLGEAPGGEYIGEKDISVLVFGKQVEVGSVKLVNPFGSGDSFLGDTGPNLKVSASSDSTGVNYSFETPLLQLGLDLDGVATVLSGNPSFSPDIQAEIGDVATIDAELFDIKYGPQIGYRETVNVETDFDVTLHFDHTIVMKDADGIVSLVDSFSGKWSNLPDISLLSDESVQVAVDFNNLIGTQTKTGSFYLTDFLDLSLLTVTELNVLDEYSLSLPALVEKKTSLLGSLLGDIELDIFSTTVDIDPIALDLAQQLFTLQAQASTRVYRTQDDAADALDDLSKWRTLDGGVAPSSLAGKTLVIGYSAAPVDHVGELTPMVFHDDGAMSEITTINSITAKSSITTTYSNIVDYWNLDLTTIQAMNTDAITSVNRLQILPGSTYEQSGVRRWQLNEVKNDGDYHGSGYTEFIATGSVLNIVGSGQMTFDGPAKFTADLLVNGEGHTIVLNAPTPFSTPGGDDTVDLYLDHNPPSSISTGNPIIDITYSQQYQNLVRSTQLFRAGALPVDGLGYQVDYPTAYNVSTHQFAISQTLDNAGTIIIDGNSVALTLSNQLANQTTGQMQVRNAGLLTINAPTFTQDGVISADGAGSMLMITGNPFITTTSTTGEFAASDGGMVVFAGTPKVGLQSTVDFGAAVQKAMMFHAAGGGEILFSQALQQRFDVQSRFVTDAGGTLTLNGIIFPEQGGVSLSDSDIYTEAASRFIDVQNHGTLIIASGRNNLFLKPIGSLDPDAPPVVPEPFIVPINLVNDGTIQINAGAEFGFQVEIKDYAEGGAKLVGGTWNLIGADQFWTNTTAPPAPDEALDPDLAVLNVDVVKISNGDNILSNVYDISAYDTKLVINEANVTLSGAASFRYFNTVQENRGTINFARRQNFITTGGLANSGAINIDTNAILDVRGDYTNNGGATTLTNSALMKVYNLVINAGSVVADASSDIRIGGANIRNELASTLTINDNYDAETNTTHPTTLDVALSDNFVIDPSGKLTLAGKEASFVGLGAALRTNYGELTIANGNQLDIDNTAGRFDNYGALNITDGGQIIVHGDFFNTFEPDSPSGGVLHVDENSYLSADSVTLSGGQVNVDGVVETGQLNITPDTTLSGSGRIAGQLVSDGDLDIGNSPGRLQVFGSVDQSETSTFNFQIAGPTAGDEYDQLVITDDVSLNGALNLSLLDGYMPVAGEVFELVNYDGLRNGRFAEIDTSAVGPLGDLTLAVLYDDDFGGVEGSILARATLLGDANVDNLVDIADLVLLSQNYGRTSDVAWSDGDFNQDGFIDIADLTLLSQHYGQTVDGLLALVNTPEPGVAGLLIVGSAICFSRRRR
ncbi:hypothetical protein HED60_00630 [Planctomycetales bacterium ZRK34]|nr:hypothetical protein HED60_00630 [Planctomycetales bacterium ZRK34]